MRTSPILVAGCLLTVQLAAQVQPGLFGYLMTGRAGTAGEFCRTFDCVPRQLPVLAGESLTLRVNAPFGAPLALGLSASATSCTTSPLFANALVLDVPITVLATGVVDQHAPWLACWDGTVQGTLTLPPGLPRGLQLATQVVALVPTLRSPAEPAFSVAVLATVF